MQEALIRRQVEAYAADPSAGASKGQSSIQIRRDWKAKEKQLQVTPHLNLLVLFMSLFVRLTRLALVTINVSAETIELVKWAQADEWVVQACSLIVTATTVHDSSHAASKDKQQPLGSLLQLCDIAHATASWT